MERRLEMGGGGQLALRQEGLRVHLTARRPEDGRGLYKVWLHGERGGSLLLGTLVPEVGELLLRRTLSVSELERAGCWPPSRAESALAFPFQKKGGGGWYCEQHPVRLLADPVLKQAAGGAMLCRREGDGFFLSAPFRTDRPFPLAPLFCLAQVERREGQPRLVWAFDRDGRPLVPHKKEASG